MGFWDLLWTCICKMLHYKVQSIPHAVFCIYLTLYLPQLNALLMMAANKCHLQPFIHNHTWAEYYCMRIRVKTNSVFFWLASLFIFFIPTYFNGGHSAAAYVFNKNTLDTIHQQSEHLNSVWSISIIKWMICLQLLCYHKSRLFFMFYYSMQ